MADDKIEVKLSAVGQAQVRQAFESVSRDAQRSSKAAASGIGSINKSLAGMRRVALGVAGAFATIQLGRQVREAISYADAIDKAAARVGVGTEALQELRFAAGQSGLEVGTLENGLRQLTVRIGEAAAGGKAAAQGFAALGIAIRNQDGTIRATADVYRDLSDKIAAISDPAARLAALRKIDRALVDHANFLQQGSAAYDKLAERARAMGLVLSDDLIKNAARANDELDVLQKVLRVNITAAVLRNADSILTLTERLLGFASAVADAIEGWSLWQARMQADASGLQNLEAIGGRIQMLVQRNVEIRERLAKITGARPRDEDFRRALERELEMNRAEVLRLQERAKTLQIQREQRPQPAPPAAPGAIDDPAARAAAEKAARERERLAEQEARRQEQLRRDRFTFEQRFLELEGRGTEARLRALDQEIEGYRILLLAMDESGELIDQRLGRFRELHVLRINFDEALRDGEAALEDLDRIRQRVLADMQNNLLTQFQGEKLLESIERERVGLLRQLADNARTAAEALGDPAAIASAERLNEQVRQLERGFNRLAQDAVRFEEGAQDAVKGGLQSTLEGLGHEITSLSGAVNAFAQNFIRQMQNIAAEILARRATFALLDFLGGSLTGHGRGSAPVKAATGGYIRGPGTSTSDSIPALLSDGEYVVRAKVVEQPGMLEWLQFVNNGGPRKQPRFSGGIPKFNQGGLATAGEFGRRRRGAGETGGSPVQVNVYADKPDRFREAEDRLAAATANAMVKAANRNN